MGIVQQFIPGIKRFRDQMNRPEEEGGMLRDGENEAVIMLDLSTDEPKPLIGFFAFQGESTVLTRMVEFDFNPEKLMIDGEED